MFRRNRIALIEAFTDNIIDDEEFMLLYDLNKVFRFTLLAVRAFRP